MFKTFLFTILVAALSAPSIAQQNDPKATEILKGVSAKYKSLTSVKADFSYQIESSNNSTRDVQSGTLYLKGNKYKVTLKNQEIISDNSTVWTYLKEPNEVQVNTYEPDENSITPSQIFTLYEKDFLYAFTEEKTVSGKVVQIIDLTPTDKTRPYHKVRLTIDKAAKMLQSAVVFDKNGNRYTYEIKTFTPNPQLADSFFAFDAKAHPGVEVIDLR